MEFNTERQPLPDDPELQNLLAEAVCLGQGFTSQVYEARKKRQANGEPPESYFQTEAKLSIAYAGNAKLKLPQREGYEYIDIQAPPAATWPDGSELNVRHHIKRQEEDDQEIVASYYVQRLGSGVLTLTTNTEDITERNIWKRARDDDGPRLHDDFAVHLELAGLRMAGYSHKAYHARKEEERLGLHNAGQLEAQALLTLLHEGELQLPNGQ